MGPRSDKRHALKTISGSQPRQSCGRAHFIERTGMVEGHLYALCDQRVRLPRLDVEITVPGGGSINVGFSAKFDGDRLDDELAGHGLTVEHRWLDPEWQYAILLARRTG
jgi:uncharacterized SAM-dependent methyltransferase